MKKLFVYLFSFLVLACGGNVKEEVRRTVTADYEGIQQTADSLYDSDNFTEAVDYYSKLIKIDSSNGKFFYRRAFCYGRLNELALSSQDLESAIKHRYREADSYYLLGVNHLLQHDEVKAAHFLNKSIELNPENEEAKVLVKNIEKKMQ